MSTTRLLVDRGRSQSQGPMVIEKKQEWEEGEDDGVGGRLHMCFFEAFFELCHDLQRCSYVKHILRLR